MTNGHAISMLFVIAAVALGVYLYSSVPFVAAFIDEILNEGSISVVIGYSTL